MKKENKQAILRLVLSLFGIGLLILLVYFLFEHLGLTSITREGLQEYIKEKGALAPLIFILATFLQVTIIPIPSTVTVLAGSYLFGPWISFIYSYVGLLLGSYFAYFLGKVLGRPYLNWVAGDAKKIDGWLAKMKGKENVVLFFAFLLPFFPDDLLCSVAGMVKTPIFTFSIMQFFTRASSIGATLLFMSGEVIPYSGWGLVVIIGSIVLSLLGLVLGLIYSSQINDYLDKLAKKLRKNKK